jgi:hypothetical protein
MVKVEVDDGLNVYGHLNVNDDRQGQGQGPGRRSLDLRQGPNPLIDTS